MGNVLVYGVRHLRTRQNIYAEDGNNCHEMPANLRRETPRIPFVRATEAKAHIKDDADAALKRRSPTATQSVTGPHNHDRRVLCQKGGLVRALPWKSGPSGPRQRRKIIYTLQRLREPTLTYSALSPAPPPSRIEVRGCAAERGFCVIVTSVT